MIPYSIAPLAQADLDEIWYYIAQDSPAAADRFVSTLDEKFLLLTTQPLIGQRCEELRHRLRSFSVGRYVIYYEPLEDQIRVVRVLHGSRDIGSLF